MNFGARFILGLVIFCLLSFAGVNFARAGSCEVVPGPVRWETGTLGKHLYVPCVGGTHIGLSCTHAVCDPAKFGGVIASIYVAADREAAYEAAVKTYLPWTCDAPPDATAVALCKERADILKPPVWRVKANGTSTTRPSTVLATGLVGPRATVGALCLPDAPRGQPSGQDIRAQWVDGPSGVVTICTKGTQ
jgi:hypothetical protein